ncbi:hypothetical protein [Streptosporangium sp. OZ121]|uniref:hypothetical protein n=1 Tax=Streptosporangium sp. OZ121 TaxID=3444183 RepID=UPI003F7936F8
MKSKLFTFPDIAPGLDRFWWGMPFRIHGDMASCEAPNLVTYDPENPHTFRATTGELFTTPYSCPAYGRIVVMLEVGLRYSSAKAESDRYSTRQRYADLAALRWQEGIAIQKSFLANPVACTCLADEKDAAMGFAACESAEPLTDDREASTRVRIYVRVTGTSKHVLDPENVSATLCRRPVSETSSFSSAPYLRGDSRATCRNCDKKANALGIVEAPEGMNRHVSSPVTLAELRAFQTVTVEQSAPEAVTSELQDACTRTMVSLVSRNAAKGTDMTATAENIRVYVTTAHSKHSNHIARPEDATKTLCGKAVTGPASTGVAGEGVSLLPGTCGNCVRLADRRGLVDAEPTPEVAPEVKEEIKADGLDDTTRETREEWLHRAVALLRPRFAAIGHEIPAKLYLSVGYSARGGGSENRRILGVCTSRSASDDNVNHIFLSPEMGVASQVLETLVHEIAHAIDDCQSGHAKGFKTIAVAIGLAGKMTATTAGEELAAALEDIAKELGPYPHGQLTIIRRKRKAKDESAPEGDAPEGDGGEGEEGDGEDSPSSSGPKEQNNRHILVKCVTDDCKCEGYQARTTKKWIAIGLPFCPAGNRMELQ